MITIDYELQLNEGDKKRIFTPADPIKKFDNTVLISGKNTSGKSFLLNLIALGFFGLDNPDIHPSLKSRIRKLVDSENQNVKFKIILEKNGTKLIAEKPSAEKKDITRYRIQDGKQKQFLDSRTFNQEYSLIYDIPNDPINRIKELLKEIASTQNRYATRLSTFNQYLNDQITEIKNEHNPQRLKQLTSDIPKWELEKQELEKISGAQKKELQTLKYAVYRKFATEYESKFDEISGEIKDVQKNADTQKKEKRKYSVQATQAMLNKKRMERNFTDALARTASSLVQLSKISSRKTMLLKANDELSDIPLAQYLANLELGKAFETALSFADGVIASCEKDMRGNEESKQVDLLEKMIALISQSNVKFEITISDNKKTAGGTVDTLQLKRLLQNELGKRKAILLMIETCKTARENISTLTQNKKELENVYAQLRIAKNKGIDFTEGEETENVVDELLKQPIERLKQYRQKRNDYARMFFEINKNPITAEECETILQIYSHLDEDGLRNKISDFEAKITKTQGDITTKKIRIDDGALEKERLEKKQPHKYQKFLGRLEIIYENSRRLESKITKEYEEYLREIIDDADRERIKSEFNSNKERREYYEQIFVYLAKKYEDKIRYQDEEYTPKKIDMINEIIETENKKIHFEFLSTGIGQTIYLLGKLSPIRNKKSIVLLDEVNMLDTASLNKVIVQINKLYQNDQLLAGLIVEQAYSQITVEKLELK